VVAELPQGTVTFLFTDIEGSTRLLHELGPSAYAEALAAHRNVLRAAFVEHGGVEVDTQGDAFFVAFPTATGAAAAALAARDGLEPGPIRVRMGLHTGEPTVTSEGYVGIDVHRGARVAALAHGRQIVLTEATRRLIGNDVAELGVHRLKDFDGPAQLFQLGTESFPALRSPGAVQLPTPATRFLGREVDLHQAISLWLEREPRVLTIVGPGGIGKTRFAIELARLLGDEAHGGTFFVPLASLGDGSLVLEPVADRLGATDADPVSIARAIGSRRTHLVLDNVEQLLPEAASPIARLLSATPTLTLLVTSREPLRIQGEIEFELPPLASAEAVSLFLERGRAVRPELEPTRAVGELCDRLDRLPLALELAAARTKFLTPEQLNERLGDRLDLLRGTRDADRRHATLRATIAWSHDLLEPLERVQFARLAVFADGCTLESAEVVCEADLETVGSLTDKSLVRRRTGRLGEERYWMLETIREFAAEQLELDTGLEALRRRHALRMLEIVKDANLSDDHEPLLQRHEVMLAEREDVRRALDWAVDADPVLGLELAVALESYWAATDPAEGARRLEELLGNAGALSPALEAAVYRVYGGAVYRQGDFERGNREHERSRDLYLELGDERGAASVDTRIAIHNAYFGELDEARLAVERLLPVVRSLALPRLEAEVVGALATLARREGRLEEAYRLEGESCAHAEACGFVWWQANALTNRMELALELGRHDDAATDGRQGLRIAVSIDDRLATLWALVCFADLSMRVGEPERGGRLLGAVRAEVERRPPPQLASLEELWAPLIGITDPAFVTNVAEGRALELADAIDLVLDESQTEP
jgi:predicted ATPase